MTSFSLPGRAGIEARNPLQSPTGEAILSRLGDRKRIFVFPSQASANSWATAILRFGGAAVVETDRFISWDSLLAESRRRSIPTGRIQADPSYRLLWASALLERQAEGQYRPRRGRPDLKPPSSLATSLATLAPRLPFLIEAAAAMADPPPGWMGENLADARKLATDYRNFLDRHGLYEASWLSPELGEGHRYLAFWPALCPGFAELKDGLLASGRFECFGGSSEGFVPETSLALRYASARDELSAVFSACRAFLDQGLRPEDIVLSLPNLDPATKAYVDRFAKSQGLPLVYRSGESLSSSPFGSLLSSVQACLGEGFSLRTFRSLAEPGPFAWKRGEELLALLRFGEKYRIPEAAFDPRETMALWKESLRVCGHGDGSLASRFAELSASANALRSARSFAALRAALHDFRLNLLDEGNLSETASETMERIFVEVEALEACETRLGGEMPKRSRFDLLLSILDSTPYTPDSRLAAIAVYPYQVGALVASAIHFVLDLSQESTRSARLHFTGLPRELADRESPETWSEADLLSALGAAGALYCHADAGISGFSVPHPFLLSLAAQVQEPGPEPLKASVEEIETAAWEAGDPGLLPLSLPSWAKKGTARGCRASARFSRGLAGTSAPTGLDSASLLGLPACGPGPGFKFSPSRLTAMGLCPFRWFISCVPGIEAPFKDPLPAAEGSLTHDLIGAVLGEIASKDGRVEEGRLEEQLSVLDRFFPSSLEAVLRRNGPSLRIALELVKPRLRARIAALLAAELQFERQGWGIGDFEVPLSAAYPDYGIRLEGRADRLALMEAPGMGADEGSVALVDYKKNKTPAKKDFLVDDGGRLADCQLAAYASILASQGRRMGAAFYWSIETCKPLTVFGPGGERPDWESFAPERRALETALAEASSILAEGRFMELKPAARTCEDCGFKAICRAHFSSERL